MAAVGRALRQGLRHRLRLPALPLLVLLLAPTAQAAAPAPVTPAPVIPGRVIPGRFTVEPVTIIDQKAVFATVQSLNVVPARARIAGTLTRLSVRAGDAVRRGQVIGIVADEKLALQITALDAEIAGLRSQLAQARIDLGRAEKLARQGAAPVAQLDSARTALEVASSSLAAKQAARAVAQQRLKDGEVHAPISGRVLSVPVTLGTVMLGGETVADIAEHHFVLRLRVPERAGRFLAKGDRVRVDPADLGQGAAEFGRITLVYPRIAGGVVLADAAVRGLGNYFVGQRVRVWIAAGKRSGFVIPADYLLRRFGLDYVRLVLAAGTIADVPVQRGEPHPSAALADGVEILAGLHAGDVLVKP